jgi:hypothetical protein
MMRRMRCTPGTALLLAVLPLACAHAPDTAQLTAVDQLITANDGAALTLNELGRQRYLLADSLLTLDSDRFAARFADTLTPPSAQALGSQWLTLRHATTMGRDHERVLGELVLAGERLRMLRADIAAGALDAGESAALIAAEQKHHTDVIGGVHAVIDNYRLLQQAWDRRDTVEQLLANTDRP